MHVPYISAFVFYPYQALFQSGIFSGTMAFFKAETYDCMSPESPEIPLQESNLESVLLLREYLTLFLYLTC
ncbi:hypothetical protein SDC9_139170 [bioreactor metagenome]|uniref:Uncharacterized protein n=1 Tax=bioreactor metagenome TaxID=1076179 RepID=A0A645DRT4_9ZZZZ